MSIERENSRDRDGLVRHQHSYDHHGRVVPMWDSSDPDRAPPPLPLNPNPNSPITTRPNTSATIAAAAAALTEKARESAGPSPYTTNPMPDRSPERSLIKGAAHRRLQSLQTPSVRDLRSYLDGARSPDRSPERPERGRSSTMTPTPALDLDKDIFSSPEKGSSRTATPTPPSRDPLRDASSIRHSSRPPPKSILGENTPPSATMLALQTMPVKDYSDPPLSNVTNGSAPRKPDEFSAISTQILSLTTICTNLQREMANLSRRSKDNATDLISLKEATNSRDEDIRKSLKELVQNLSSGINNTGLFGSSSRSAPGFGTQTPPPPTKTFTLPRIPSPNSLFEDRVGSPSPYSMDGVASVAMLEKIIREMVTKEGQEHIINTLSNLFDKASKDSGETAKKVEEMRQQVKELAGQSSRALVPCNHGNATSDLEPGSEAGPLTRTTREVQSLSLSTTGGAGGDGQKSFSSPKAADFVSEEMIKLLKKIKESVTQTGGMVGEVKAQQRDLRGEVLHMGRDIARKIDEARTPASGALAIEDGSGKQDIARIVQEGLAELKQHLDDAMREKRRQSSSTTISRSSVNSQEVYDVVKHTLSQQGIERLAPQQALNAGLDKEAILNAVKEAYEEYKPDVSVEQFGLEREEILQCLREGLEQYRPAEREEPAMSREEIMSAIHDAMKDFQPPPPINEANDLRDEILMAVRECLDEFKPSLALSKPAPQDHDREMDITREVVLDAVKAALAANGPNASREIEISRDDLFDAIQASLESSGSPFGRFGEQVINQLQEMVQEMRGEFKDYSTANGRDTEQVLDAMKDGLETLRGEIEQYVDRAQDVTSKDEIIDTVRGGLESLRIDVEAYCAAGPQGENALNRSDMLSYIKSEFEHLHDAINSQGQSTALVAPPSDDKAVILGAIHDGFESLKADMSSRGVDDFGGEEMQEAMKTEIEQLREAVIGGSSVHKDEIIDMLQSGFDTLHGKIDGGAFASGSDEEALRSIKEELEHLRETLTTTMTRAGDAEDKTEILTTMQAEFEGLRETLTTSMTRPDDVGEKTEILTTMQGEFTTLRETLTTAITRSGDDGDNSEILTTMQGEFETLREAISNGTSSNAETVNSIQQSLDALREQLAGDNGATSKEVLDAIQSEFAQLRESYGSALVRGGGSSGSEEKNEVLEALRSTLETVQDMSNRSAGGIDEDMLGAIRGEFEVLRSTIATGFSRTTQRADTEDILEAVRLAFDDLRSELVKKIENPEPHMKATGELLDALNEGLESLKNDVGLANKPIDMTVSYEILDTLKEGIASLREDIDKLKSLAERSESDDLEETHISIGNEVVLAEPDIAVPREIPLESTTQITQALQRNDIEKVEVMLAQLQIKVDALDANVTDPAFRAQEPAPAPEPVQVQPVEGTAMKVDLEGIENLIRDLQGTVDIIASRELDATVAKKEDTDAIETLLQNTKAKLDEMELPDPAAAASKEQLEAVDSLLKSTREAIDELTVRVDDKVATKEDISVVEVLVQDLKTAMDEMKSAKPDEEEESEKIRKADLDIVGLLALEIKDKLSTMHNLDPESLPSKADVEQLTGLIHDFRESHDTLKENYESDVAVTAKAFDDRKQEAEDVITAIGIVKSYLSDVKEELKSKLDVSALETTSLADNFKILEKTIESNFNVTADIKELMETVSREFERVHGTVEDVKMQSEQRASEDKEKHDEANASVIAEIGTKLDEKFDTIMVKYDDAQAAAEANVKAMEEKAAEQEVILQTTKVIADELKLSVDTLGTTVTSMEAKFTEVADKLGEDSQTVFNKLEEGFGKLDDVETRASANEEHQLTRDEISKAMDALNGISSEATEFHPKFMVTLQEVLALINQQHEETQRAHEAVHEQARAATEHTRSLTDEIKNSFTALPALLPPPPVVEPVEKYDDTQVQEKLDTLMVHVHETKEASAQLDRLDKIHQQVMATAAEVSAFVTTQTRLITEGHESKQKEVEEMALLLERRVADKEHLENDIHGLSSEKESLLAVIETLRSERDAIAAQKARMSADVSALETALSIRKEELHAMDAKADALERRVLEGIMNQSRLLMMTKGHKVLAQDATRNASNASHSTLGQLPPPSAAAQGLGMALKARPGAMRRNAGPTGANTARRVMSLNPITHNTPTGAQGFHAASASPGSLMKRSQSVRNPGVRKVSWNSMPDKEKRRISTSALPEDKENEAIGGFHSDDEDLVSDSGTERRISYATDTEGTDRHDSEYTGGSYMTGSEYTGSSYMTGSELSDRRTSYGSTRRSTLGPEAIDEEGEEDEYLEGESVEAEAEAGAEEETLMLTEGDTEKDMVVYAPPSDSGLGSDMPTAAGMNGGEVDYFRRAAEEAA